ncbi:MAG: AAA family ATPase [Treponema sp.]|nr:AAA family ATPase [Treponema sp.]
MPRCGLLGRKLAHSYSPAIHEAFGGYSYALFEVEPPELAAFMERKDIDGLNVTVPYKQQALPFCRELSSAALEIGSVNTMLRMPGGGFYGDNTDAAGFKNMAAQSEITVAGRKVLVFGKGGSSLAVCHAMKELGAGEITVVSRADNHREFLLAHKDSGLLVNATPVGMYPDTENTPVSLDYFPRLEGVLDLIYNPARTRLMMDAQERGLPCAGGLSMLVGQAAAASEIFTGRKIDTAEEQAVIRMLRRRMENIVLVGMPGCGKTTIGRLLAEKMNRPLIDTDAEIAQTAGRSIPEIFDREGETGFRERETAAIKKFGKESGLVLATGGGCVTREENYRHLRQNGNIIFVERSPAKLGREGRPLSQGDLQAMYAERLPLYRHFAGFTVQNEGALATVAERVMEALDEITGN